MEYIMELCTAPFVLLIAWISRLLFKPDPPREPDGFTVELQESSSQWWGESETLKNVYNKQRS